jgi:hypothetical protein
VFNIIGDRLIGQSCQLVQFTVQAIQFWNLQQVTGMVQPGLQTLDARQLLGQVFRLLLVARSDAGRRLRPTAGAAASWRPGQRTLAVAAHIALQGPGAGQQPAGRVQ